MSNENYGKRFKQLNTRIIYVSKIYTDRLAGEPMSETDLINFTNRVTKIIKNVKFKTSQMIQSFYGA